MPSLDQTCFVVTDTETTGPKAGQDRIIELGAVKVQHGEVIDRFQSLINPERTVPKNIQRLTGISTAMVVDEPLMEDILPDYLDFLGDDVLVAHNLSFDEKFLNAALTRLGHEPLSNDTLCSLRLARRLLPGLKSRGLSALSTFYDVRVNGRHRALGDAEATGRILMRFLNQCAFEHQIDTLDELMRFQNRSYRNVRSAPPHIDRLRNETLPTLPDAPGVYFFKASNGTTLYIGKAKRLSNRVRSYFSGIESKPTRTRKLLKKLRRITWRTTDTELEALLLEARLIKEKKPSYNRAQRRYRRRPFLMLDRTASYPRLGWSYRLEDDTAAYYGPVRNADQAELIIDMAARRYPLRECDDDTLRLGQRCLYADMDRCLAPCEDEVDADYDTAVDQVESFLEGRSTELLGYLHDRMRDASEKLDFERAAQFRDGHDAVERFVRRQQLWQAPVRTRQGVVWYHDDIDGTMHGLWIRHGRLRGTTVYDADTRAGAACTKAQTHIDTWLESEEEMAVTKRAINEIRLGMHWLYRHRNEICVVPWRGTLSAFQAATRRAWAELRGDDVTAGSETR